MTIDKHTPILVVEDYPTAIMGIQDILKDTLHLCGITFKGAQQALKVIIEKTPPRIALIVDGGFSNFSNSSEIDEFFPGCMDRKDFSEWKKSLSDAAHYDSQKAYTYMDSLFSTTDFSVVGEDGKNNQGRYMASDMDRASPGGYFISFVLRLLKSGAFANIPLCFLCNSADSGYNKEMARIISEESSNRDITVIIVPKREDDKSEKNHSPSIEELLKWVRQDNN